MSLSVAPLDPVQMLGQMPGAPVHGHAGVEVASLQAQAASRPSAHDAAAFAQAATSQAATSQAAAPQAAAPQAVVSGTAPVQAVPEPGQAQRTAATEVQAAPPSAADNLGSRLAHQADALVRRFNSLEARPAPADVPAEGLGAAPAAATSAKDGAAPSLLEAGTEGAIGQMERAYLFAIEATMASHGSTEATKVFNTLLKGQ